jgi:hypothetical protein
LNRVLLVVFLELEHESKDIHRGILALLIMFDNGGAMSAYFP